LVASLLDVERTAREVATVYGNVAGARRPLSPPAEAAPRRTTAPLARGATEAA
jgi:hypothetical protein